MIRCKDIHKSYNEKEVLKGISFDIDDGKIFGLLGPSGAGKTTLIKILTGQLDYEKGEAYILNKAVSELNGNDRKNKSEDRNDETV
ncbi:MAG: ATP-binding cassette domain-containing protein [Lachnospiraceae bacterium]|nr:ATP-binding cassette domain-containing protein [Lachnospiraceae bacterium]